MRRFRVEIGGFVTNAALSANFGAIKEPEGKKDALDGKMRRNVDWNAVRSMFAMPPKFLQI